MTLPQLAARLGLKSTGSLRAQVLRGVIKAEKHGRDWFVSEAEASRYALEHQGKIGRKRHPTDIIDRHLAP